MYTDNGLRLEGGGALNKVSAPGHKEGKNEDFELSGEFILATLARHFDGEGDTLLMYHGIHNGRGDILLIWVQLNHLMGILRELNTERDGDFLEDVADGFSACAY